MKRKELTIGLFGFGCAGYGLYEVLQKTPGLKAAIKRICIKDADKPRPIPAQHFTLDRNDILDDENINVIVELIDDADAAYEIVSAALKKGKAVVTANKKMLAEHFNELLTLQRRYKTPLLYEAACCASIPIIRNLEEYYDNDLLESLEGIVNGSTNYILTKTAEENISYRDALKDAQQKGYAESNPILDTGGFDSKYKLQLLIAHAFGLITMPDEIFNLGIDNINELDLKYARENELKIKLVAHAEKTKDGKIAAFVLPKFIGKNDKLYGVNDVFNGIKTKSCFSDTQFFVGKGAGAYPTASAVLSDLSALTYDYRYEYKKLESIDVLEDENNIYFKSYISHHPSLTSNIKSYFETIDESYLNHSSGYIIGIISLKKLKEALRENNEGYSAIIFDAIIENALELKKQRREYALVE